MFEQLDDPHPPTPDAGHRERVHRRARQIRRRRLAVTVPALALSAIVAATVLALLAGGEPDHLRTVDEDGNRGPVVEHAAIRGEVLEVEGALVRSDVIANEPRSALFDRTVRVEFADGRGATITRAELAPTDYDELLAAFAEPTRTSPGGREHLADPDRPDQVIWLAAPDLVIAVVVDDGLHAVEVLDAVSHRPPDPRCVTADQILETGPCAETEVVVVEGPDGRDEADTVPG